MSAYIVRRLIQAVIVIFVASVVTYGLLLKVPGGPLSSIMQAQQSDKNRITSEDFNRMRAWYELDLDGPIRFTRWLLGVPRGPIVIGGTELFANTPIGCFAPVEREVQRKDGSYTIAQVGCDKLVYLRDLAGRRTSRGLLLGDFGSSWQILRERPVSILLASRLPFTLQLMFTSTMLAILIGIPIGIYAAVKQYSRFDYAATTFAFFGASMPTYFFGIVFILIFAVGLKYAGLPYLPPGNAVSVKDYVIPLLGRIGAASASDRLLHMIMPVTVLVIFNVAQWSRFVRSSMLEVMRQDYVRTARAKGLIERIVIMRHALRNALIPFVTIVVLQIPGLFAGAIITETVFNWPGLGRLYFDGLGRSDWPVVMALFFITAILTVFATLIADLLYTVLDPRIRFS
ncbi:MAG: ABC transporter permease [Anaerolineae bacterium]|nr:ABC transporter permease [Anaerolineae bacterium]